MHHLRACRRQSERANAGIAKQVHGNRVGNARQLLPHPAPHRVHIWEEAQMAKRCAGRGKMHFVIPRQSPSIDGDGFVIIPTTAAIIV